MTSLILSAFSFLVSNYVWVIGSLFCLCGVNICLYVWKKYAEDRALWEVIKDIPDLVFNMDFQNMSHAPGPLRRLRLPDGYLISAMEPETAKCVLAAVGDGVLTTEGDKWVRHRKMLTPAFHFGVLGDYVNLFQVTVQPYLGQWSEQMKTGESIDVTGPVDEMTLKALLKCAFGNFPLSEEQQKDITNCVHDIIDCYIKRYGSLLLYFDFIYYRTPDGRRFLSAIQKTREVAQLIVRQKRKQHEEDGQVNEKKYKDFLDIITEARDEKGNSLTEDEILDEIQTFFFAGQDTTASAIPYLIYNLAGNPEYQDKCRQEIEQVMGEEKEITWELIGKLKFVNMCIKESLRLHPPIWIVVRKSVQPTALPDGRVLPAGTQVGVGIHAIMHHPDIWKDPHVFNPYRFEPDNVSSKHPYAYLPFSAGPRNCIGQNFALTEIRVFLMEIIRRFRLSLDPNKPLEITYNGLMRTKRGMWIKFSEV